MLRSMFSGRSGLSSHQVRMDVIGNNIANVNTIGFKASRVLFKDMMSQTLRYATSSSEKIGGVNGMQVGIGVTAGQIDTLFTQGNTEVTNKNSDFAIKGEGFFIVNNGERDVYTRAGAMSLDSKGYLINTATGFRTKGWGSMQTVSGDIEIDSASVPNQINIWDYKKLPAKTTSVIDYMCNLDSRSDARKITTDNNQFVFVDNVGNEQVCTIKFDKVDANTWNWIATDDTEAVGQVATGTLILDDFGKILESSVTSAAGSMTSTSGATTPYFEYDPDGGEGVPSSATLASNNTAGVDSITLKESTASMWKTDVFRKTGQKGVVSDTTTLLNDLVGRYSQINGNIVLNATDTLDSVLGAAGVAAINAGALEFAVDDPAFAAPINITVTGTDTIDGINGTSLIEKIQKALGEDVDVRLGNDGYISMKRTVSGTAYNITVRDTGANGLIQKLFDSTVAGVANDTTANVELAGSDGVNITDNDTITVTGYDGNGQLVSGNFFVKPKESTISDLVSFVNNLLPNTNVVYDTTAGQIVMTDMSPGKLNQSSVRLVFNDNDGSGAALSNLDSWEVTAGDGQVVSGTHRVAISEIPATNSRVEGQVTGLTNSTTFVELGITDAQNFSIGVDDTPDVQITGLSSGTYAEVSGTTPLTMGTTLSSLGITDASSFTIDVDEQGTPVTIPGLSVDTAPTITSTATGTALSTISLDSFDNGAADGSVVAGTIQININGGGNIIVESGGVVGGGAIDPATTTLDDLRTWIDNASPDITCTIDQTNNQLKITHTSIGSTNQIQIQDTGGGTIIQSIFGNTNITKVGTDTSTIGNLLMAINTDAALQGKVTAYLDNAGYLQIRRDSIGAKPTVTVADQGQPPGETIGYRLFSDNTPSTTAGDDGTTVGELVTAINNQVPDATARLDSSGRLVITRDVAGKDPSVSVSDSGDTALQIFGVSNPRTTSGTDKKYKARDVFTPSDGSASTVLDYSEFSDGDMIGTPTLGMITINAASLKDGYATVFTKAATDAGKVRMTVPVPGKFQYEFDATLGLASKTDPDPVIGVFNPGAKHGASITVYDSLGFSHVLSAVFEKADEQEWDYSYELSQDDDLIQSYLNNPANNIKDPKKPTDIELRAANDAILNGRKGTLVFGQNGKIDLARSTIQPVKFSPENRDDVVINPDFNLVSQFDSEFTTAAQSQDGYGMGTMEDFSVDEDGTIRAYYDNGVKRPVARIALATFTNIAGLSKIGNNLYVPSANSGVPLTGKAGTGSYGIIAAGELEMSNVDLTNEFTNMIITQRGFQANSRTITVSDEMIQDLLSLKR